MKLIFKNISAFFFDNIDPKPAALCRVATGITLLLSTISKTQLWSFYYSTTGWISTTTNINPQFNKPYGLLYYTDGYISIWVYYMGLLLATICFIIGLKTKTAAITCLLILQSLAMRNPYSIMSYDMIIRSIIFFACFGGFAGALALDARQKITKLQLVWSVRMVQLNLCLIYILSILGKIFEGEGWLDGGASYWFLINPSNGLSYITHFPFLLNNFSVYSLTIGALLVQLQFVILIWIKKFQLSSYLMMFSFHYFLFISSPSLRLFSLSMIATLLIFTPLKLINYTLRWGK